MSYRNVMNVTNYIISIAVLCFVYVGAYAALNYTSRDSVVNNLTSSVDDEQVETLDTRINWNKLRYNLNKDLGAQTKNREMIVHYVQPEFVQSLFVLKQHYFPDAKAQDFIREVSFNGPFRFSVLAGYPQTDENRGNPTLKESMSHARAFFHLEGWNWRIYKIEVPDFFMPQTKLSPEDIEARYGVSDAS